jgi:peroxiredoxin Q/BCP
LAKASSPAAPSASPGFLLGSKAPDFSLPSSDGRKLGLKDFKGRQVVLYFYPKDDTPGCTVEACEFGAAHSKFTKKGAVVLGISPDPLKSHAKFIEKFKLPFILLSDEGHKVAEKYGLWVEKINFGHKYMGVRRATFLIDKDGKFAKIWPQVRAQGHAAEVLENL